MAVSAHVESCFDEGLVRPFTSTELLSLLIEFSRVPILGLNCPPALLSIIGGLYILHELESTELRSDLVRFPPKDLLRSSVSFSNALFSFVSVIKKQRIILSLLKA